MIRLILLLAIIGAVLIAVKMFMDYRSVDRPERIGRKDRKAFEANYVTLNNALNEIDVLARSEQMINSTNHFAWAVSNEVTKARKELA